MGAEVVMMEEMMVMMVGDPLERDLSKHLDRAVMTDHSHSYI